MVLAAMTVPFRLVERKGRGQRDGIDETSKSIGARTRFALGQGNRVHGDKQDQTEQSAGERHADGL